MQKQFLTGAIFIFLFISGIEVGASPSNHTVTVDRVFSARSRSMSYRYFIQITCQPEGESMIRTPAKNASFKWKIGAESGSSTTDSRGRAEFTQTAFDGNLKETMEIDYQKQHLIFFSR